MKKFLTENKIYFDLTSSILFGAAAVLVAIASYTISKQQLLLSEISLKPHFYVENTYSFNPKTEKYDESELYIFNIGGPISNLKFDLNSFLVVDYPIQGIRRKTILPIIGYYPAQFRHQTPKGKLVTFKGHLNNENYHRLYREFLDQRTNKIFGFVDIDLMHIIQITYTNYKGETERVYFRDTTLVSEEKVGELFEAHSSRPVVEIEGIDAETLMKEVSKYESGA